MNKVAAYFLAITGALVMAACLSSPAPPPPADAKPEAPKQSPAERGKYLVEAVGGCDDCHTPKNMGPNGPEPDMSRRLSGHPENAKLGPAPKLSGEWMAAASADFTAWSGPWGLSYTANLTPDENTGLGIWTEDMFIAAIRTGKHMGKSRPILPPMPVHIFKNLTDDDLKAVYAFLKTLPPVTNHVPDPVIAPPPPGAKK